MYSVRSGNPDRSSTDPIERVEYMLEQMRIYLLVFKDRTGREYEQVGIIFNSLLNVMTETNYNKLCNELTITSERITGTGPRSGQYWNEYLKFMHWKLTGRTD